MNKRQTAKQRTIGAIDLLFHHELLTYRHSLDVGAMSLAMGSLLGLNDERCYQMGLLHDIGKLGVNADILALRFKIHFPKIWNAEQKQYVEYYHVPTDQERGVLRLHGKFGAAMLQYMGFDEQFQQIAERHGRENFNFEETSSQELIIVTLADWFSAIKDYDRNAARKTDFYTLEKAVQRMHQEFDRSTSNVPENIKRAFFDAIKLGVYPGAHFKNKFDDMSYTLYKIVYDTGVQSSVDGDPWRYEAYYQTLPNFSSIKLNNSLIDPQSTKKGEGEDQESFR